MSSARPTAGKDDWILETGGLHQMEALKFFTIKFFSEEKRYQLFLHVQ